MLGKWKNFESTTVENDIIKQLLVYTQKKKKNAEFSLI